MKIASGDTVLVTGGAGAIGLAVARSAAARGANAVLCDRHEERLESALASFETPALAIAMDVGSQAEWTRAAARVTERFGQVEVLVNCAGSPPAIKPVLELSEAEFLACHSAHVMGNFLAIRTFGPAMRDRGRGHIACVASEAGVVPMANLGEYATAKYGIVGLAEVLDRELAGTGVGVTVIMPGLTLSNMTIGMGMEARFVGEAIVRGIEADQLYVFTHPWVRTALERRFAAILDSIGEPADPDFVLPRTEWE